MAIDRIPGVYYEENVTFESTGNGSKIPIFIGKTGNTGTASHKVDGTQVLKFASYEEVNRTIADGGIGEETTTVENTVTNNLENNLLLKTIKEFYQEARILQSSDIGVPYIYVVDVGAGTVYNSWKNAIETVKAYYDAPVEVYVGLETCVKDAENHDIELKDLISVISKSIHDATEELNLRYAFFTKQIANSDVASNVDDALKTLAQACVTAHSNKLQYLSRVGLIEPYLFGKSVSRICCTENTVEPGYYEYRSVDADVFPKRTREKAYSLQSNGIIFNRDEYINGDKHPKMNLCVSLAFNGQTSRPADSLFHARFNADDLLREVFGACYNQIKANESTTNIVHLQSRINKIVNDRISAEEMLPYNDKTELGTRLQVRTDDSNPYTLVVSGQIHPQKCTIAIKVEATVKI